MEGTNKKKFGTKKEIAKVNMVTALRFIGSFLVIPIFKVLGGISAAAFSTIFLFTDFIDGHLARKYNASTFFGALFDGVTDKAYGIMAFALLMTINPVLFSIPLLMEIAIVLTQNKKLQNGLNVQSNMMGKIKTWFLGFSIVGSFIAVDLLNLPPFLEYIKYASLDKVATIKDALILLGIELPAIVTQILTLKSYNKENSEGLENIQKNNEPGIDETVVLEEQDTEELTTEQPDIEEPAVALQTIADEKQRLQEEMTLLEKAKALGNVMFDPEYYAQNKDMPIRTLTRELFKKNQLKR